LIFLLAAGFDPELAGILVVVQIITGLFLHANVRWRWRALHRIVITPEFHHWHHANEVDALNSNYSVFLPLWDMWFDTYFMPRTRRPQQYGISEPMPDGVMDQLRHPISGLPTPLWVLRHPIGSIRLTWRSVRRGMGQVRASTCRPRRPVLS
jgi:sterol desaturase/sphingolipid hydroxylase (fatty acid hydroxylase superfamily)